MRDNDFNSIPIKANLVLNLFLIAFILIAIRLWHLTVIQYDEKFEQAKRPLRKTVFEPIGRATIRDRFNIPYAINKVAYRVSVTYAPMREIPSVKWEIQPDGTKIKKFPRKEYIENLSLILGEELDMDPSRVKDLIYSKAALYFNLPYILKEEISEEDYYRLKMMEKDFPGLFVEKYAKREYPKGKSAGDVIGYLGAISRSEYESTLREMKALSDLLAIADTEENPPLPEKYSSLQEVRKRHKELCELAYTSQDFVGKTGIEGLFEQNLRGFQGKKIFYSDSKGHLLKSLPGGRRPISGKRVLTTLSSELQEYAEILLAQNEDIRKAKISTHAGTPSIKPEDTKQPWIKGGAIVAIDPKTGELLALASYPRFDPNDFILTKDQDVALGKKARINKWFENENYLSDLWNLKVPLERERYDSKKKEFYEEKKWITFENYFDLILPKEHPISDWFLKNGTIGNVYRILSLLPEAEKNKPLREILKNKQDAKEFDLTPLGKELSFLKTPYLKLLFIDLCSLFLDETRWDKKLLKELENQSISNLRKAETSILSITSSIKEISKELFHSLIFSKWREKNEKTFLKGKRKEEEMAKTYPKPYLDYLDEKEAELFNRFYEKMQFELLFTLLFGKSFSFSPENPFFVHFKTLHDEIEKGAYPEITFHKQYFEMKKILSSMKEESVLDYLKALREFNDLVRPLRGKYRGLRNGGKVPLEKHLASAFYPPYGFGFGRSSAYRQSSPLGSLFKLVTAHEALLQMNEDTLKKGKGVFHENPLKVIDNIFKSGSQTYVGYTSTGKPIPQLYKGGRIPRSHLSKMGEMDLVRAIETSSNLYFSLLAGDHLKNPNDLKNAAIRFGFGEKTGIELPGEIKGKVPDDLETNRTGLYAMAIGQHTLVVTPLQAALMLSTIANSGELLKPEIIKALAGVSPSQSEKFLEELNEESDPLSILGIDFPLFNKPLHQEREKTLKPTFKVKKKDVIMPKALRSLLIDSMHKVVLKTQAESLVTLSRMYKDHPEAISDYIDLKNHLVGKTSTAEQMERIDMDEEFGTNLYTHVWFGGIAFEDEVTKSKDNPELVVVVYLKYGAYGKEAAPIAAQIAEKWREIKREK